MKKFVAVILSLIILMSSFSVTISAFDWDGLESDTSFKTYNELLRDMIRYPKKYYDSNAYMNYNQFAIADINDDGIDELIVCFIGLSMAEQYMGVWTFDRSIGRVRYFDTLGAYSAFYKTGYVRSDASHNHGPGETIWPYSVFQINTKNSSFDYFAQAWCADLDYCLNFSYFDYYRYMNDVDNDGILFFFRFSYEPDDRENPITYRQYLNYQSQYIPDESEIKLNYYYITEQNIKNVNANYGSDLSSDGTMTGDLNADNKITAADARFALRFAAKIDTPDNVQMKLADVDSNGKITAADARKILRVAAKLDEFDNSETGVPPEPPVTPAPAADFDKLSDALILTGCVPFDYQYNDASYIIENILFNGYYPSGYTFYSDDYSEIQDNYYDNNMDPYNWFPYYYVLDAETVRWICEEIYHTDCAAEYYWSPFSYFYNGKVYVNSEGPTGGEGGYWLVINTYSVNSEGKYEIYAERYYNSGFYGEPDEYIGAYYIVADWQEIDGEYYWTFYSVEEL